MAFAGDDEDPFEDVRERASNPMERLFVGYGRAYVPYFTVGVVTSIAARLLDLLPPILLGIAIDSVFRDTVPFDSRLPISWLPEAWLPVTPEGKFWFTVGLIGFSFAGAAIFH